jgi:hypothetical protein
MKYSKMTALLTILLMSSLTLCSQNTSKDSLCFSKPQAVKILKDLKRLEYCDSITQNQAFQIINFKSISRKDFEIIALKNGKISRQEKEINTLGLKLKISKRLTLVGLPAAIIGGFLVGSMLSK